MYVMWLLLFYFVHQSLLVLLYADEKLSCASLWQHQLEPVK